MKRLLVNFIFIFSATVISSCAFVPGISLTKRNFRDGYYLDFISGKKNKSEFKPETISADKLIEQPVDVLIKILPENNLADLSPEKTGFSVLKKNNNEIQRKVIRKANSPDVISGAGGLNKNIFSRTISSVKLLSKIPTSLVNFPKTSNSTASVNHEGGEIIWTIIGVLILLWLLSLLTGGWGLGGLIYILLVVAIILAILRLLEVL